LSIELDVNKIISVEQLLVDIVINIHFIV